MGIRIGFSCSVVLWLVAVPGLAGENGAKYDAATNHREMVIKALQLAVSAGFVDTSMSLQDIQDRLEAGVYSEDFDPIPGVPGSTFPSPWDKTPTFDFTGWLPDLRIPYGSLADDSRSSGWYRGLNHGYDPVSGYRWPGADTTTVGWADASQNAFSWHNALALSMHDRKAEAYECLGHVLHLLMDLSVPAHVKVVNHGASLTAKKDGLLHPDLGIVIIDEYEMALSGGLQPSAMTAVIPDLSADFKHAVDSARVERIPLRAHWSDYLTVLATYTYNSPLVNQYYAAPDSEGHWGSYLDGSGHSVSPHSYGIAPISPIDGRLTQLFLQGTADVVNGPIIPAQAMKEMCADLVPRAVEESAGLILTFASERTIVGVRRSTNPGQWGFALDQNYPNPFNPKTAISYQLSAKSFASLKVFDVLGREVVTLVNEAQPPGRYSVEFDARNLASGVYFYRLRAGDFVNTKKLVVLR